MDPIYCNTTRNIHNDKDIVREQGHDMIRQWQRIANRQPYYIGASQDI